MSSNDYWEYKAPAVLRYIDSIKYRRRYFWPSLQISLTDKCFNKCMLCGHWQRRSTFTSAMERSAYNERLLQFLTIGRVNGLESVGYSGGDPMAVPITLNKIMAWHVANKVAFGIVTAGQVPSVVDVGLLREASWVRVSLDAVDPDLYRKIRGVDIDPFIAGAKGMVRDGVRVGLGITLSKPNIYHIPEIAAWAIDNGIKEFRLWPTRRHDTSKEYHADRTSLNNYSIELSIVGSMLDEADIDNNISNIIDLATFGDNVDFVWPCYASLYQAFVDANGKIYPCCTLAGDTETDIPAGYSVLGDIDAPLGAYANALEEFRLQSIGKTCPPEYCFKHCVVKHRIANTIADDHWDDVRFQ